MRYVEELKSKRGKLSVALRGDFDLCSDVDVVVSKSRRVKFVGMLLELIDVFLRLELVCWTPEEAVVMM